MMVGQTVISTSNTGKSPGRSSSVLAIDHVAIAVRDIDSAVDWYSRALGLSLGERRVTYGKSTSMSSAVLTAGSAVVVLVQGMSADSQVTRFIDHFGEGVQHLALAVNDLDSTMDAVRARGGIGETPVIQDTGIRQVFLRRDPGSGVRVELIERRGGQFTDQSIERLFKAFEERKLF